MVELCTLLLSSSVGLIIQERASIQNKTNIFTKQESQNQTKRPS